MNLEAVAVELDLVNPARPARDLVDRGRQGWLNEPGPRCLDAESLPAPRKLATPRHSRDSTRPGQNVPKSGTITVSRDCAMARGGANGQGEQEDRPRTRAGPRARCRRTGLDRALGTKRQPVGADVATSAWRRATASQRTGQTLQTP